LDGKAVNAPGPDRGFVFQNDNLYPWRTVLGNATFGLEVQRAPDRRARERAMAMIELVGLKGFENSYPNELSGGMRQRVNLARAISRSSAVRPFKVMSIASGGWWAIPSMQRPERSAPMTPLRVGAIAPALAGVLLGSMMSAAAQQLEPLAMSYVQANSAYWD